MTRTTYQSIPKEKIISFAEKEGIFTAASLSRYLKCNYRTAKKRLDELSDGDNPSLMRKTYESKKGNKMRLYELNENEFTDTTTKRN